MTIPDEVAARAKSRGLRVEDYVLEILAQRLGPERVSAREARTPEYVQTVNKLIELLELPERWNSYNAKPISKENVTFAVALLAQVMGAGTPAPHVVPKVRGGVQLEWHTRGINLEISIDSPGHVSFSAEDLRGVEEPVEEGALDEPTLTKWVGRLSA